ncbi:SDR family oxidoreductase [Alphaproteobacteria bacterium]|nr:SDR family oxidoreductase [Alphaproteobacteria bacterium]
MELGLKNKKVLITGGTSGIGLETLKGFLSEGAQVISLNKDYQIARDIEVKIKKLFPNSVYKFLNCDCAKYNEVLAIYKAIYNDFGDIDILINNIGSGSGTNDPLPSQKDWNLLWNVNFQTAQNITSVFLNSLLKSQGNITYVGSIVSKETLNAPTPYTVAKSALLSFAKTLATKYGYVIRVNTVSPGNVMVPGGGWDQKLKSDKDYIMNYIENNVPMNRFGLPHEIADAILFLASNRANFINGANLIIDGGQTKGIF